MKETVKVQSLATESMYEVVKEILRARGTACLEMTWTGGRNAQYDTGASKLATTVNPVVDEATQEGKQHPRADDDDDEEGCHDERNLRCYCTRVRDSSR